MPTATSSPSHTDGRPRAISGKLAPRQGSRSSIGGDNSPLQPSRLANTNLMSVNDDAAEKAKRRKSAHFGELSAESSSKPSNSTSANKRVVSALAVQAANANAPNHAQGTGQRKAKRLSTVAPAMPVISMEVMNTNFEEWMKLATDNKITANNTWNFALIDYFADLTLLRNGPDDQSINFQKASCTLDGCIKIWTSRVDSVATETGKLLSGLAGGSGDADVEEGEEGDDEEGGEPKATRKTTHRSEATLAKSFAQLQVKKFDLEFTVDPLFKKTCADFDEGGAMGLLMNHLNVDGKGRVVFDAGDAGAEEDEDEDEAVEEEEMVDLDKLREFVPSIEANRELSISTTLSSFQFSSDPDAMPDFTTLFGLKDTYHDDDSRPMLGDDGDEFDLPAPTGTGETHDFFGDEDFDMGAGGAGGFDDGASMAGDDGEGGDVFGAASLAMARPGESHGPFDPRRQGGQGELVMAFGTGDDDEGMFDYFDKGFGKAWAGAEHWKLRKVTRKDVGASNAGASAGAAGKPSRAAKQPFTIDFSSPSTSATSSKTLFASATKASLSLPSRKKSSSGPAKRKEEWLLPDDMHFSSRQLLRLFLKPKFSLRMRRNATAARMAENVNGEIDENFWAQAAADRADGDVDGDGMDIDSQAAPFESQFFHDDGDDAFVDDMVDLPSTGMEIEEADDLWQGTQGQELRKSRPENVNFAKKAKRVDVKRLKDDIWSGLRELVPAEKDDISSDEAEEPTTPEPKTFDSIITSLRSSYPQEKMSEISTSFCFICLLHLANEEGLRIETDRFDGKDGEHGFMGLLNDQLDQDMGVGEMGGMDKDDRKDRIVGELQALKVYKDPNAGRAA